MAASAQINLSPVRTIDVAKLALQNGVNIPASGEVSAAISTGKGLSFLVKLPTGVASVAHVLTLNGEGTEVSVKEVLPGHYRIHPGAAEPNAALRDAVKCVGAKHVFGLKSDQSIVTLARDQVESAELEPFVSYRAPGRYTLVCSDTSDVAYLINRANGEYRSVDGSGKLSPVQTPAATEFAKALSLYVDTNDTTGDQFGVVVLSGIIRSGHLFYLLYPYSETEGAIVLEVGDHANVVRSFRCSLPVEPGSGKLLKPVAIGFLGENLALISPAGFVALYTM